MNMWSASYVSSQVPAREQVLEEVRQIVAERAGMAPAAIEESHALETDLGLDSLDRVEIVMEVEEEFDILVPEEVSDKVRTVGDIVEGVLRLIGPHAA
jgi:acyl carrier protein